MFVVGMFLLACGCALLVDTFIAANGVALDAPLSGTPSAQKLRRTRIAAVSLGLILVMAGLVMLLVADSI